MLNAWWGCVGVWVGCGVCVWVWAGHQTVSKPAVHTHTHANTKGVHLTSSHADSHLHHELTKESTDGEVERDSW